MDTTALSAAYDDLLEAARAVHASDHEPTPPAGEWNADQILAHVVLLNAATVSAACSVTSGTVATYDNRLSQDAWTIDRTIALAGGNDGLRSRIRLQADALCAIRAARAAALVHTGLDAPFPHELVALEGGLACEDRAWDFGARSWSSNSTSTSRRICFLGWMAWTTRSTSGGRSTTVGRCAQMPRASGTSSIRR